MAGADYKQCHHCGTKAYYDADTDYGEAHVVALCRDCKKSHVITTQPVRGILGADYLGSLTPEEYVRNLRDDD